MGLAWRVTVPIVKRHAVIVGSGIAGLAAAISLTRLGFSVTIAERNAERRMEGHFIRWLGAGTHALRRFDIPQIPDRADTTVRHVELNIAERRSFGVGLHEMPGTPSMILRGDVEETLFRTLADAADIRYGTTVQDITQTPDGVRGMFRTSAGEEPFTADLLLGADGVRSATRRALFGPDAQFASETGHLVATWFAPHEFTEIPANEAPVFIEPGRAIWLFRYHNHAPCILVAYEATDTARDRADGFQVSFARAFADAQPGGMVEELLQSANTAEAVIFDTATHIDVPQFTQGNVTLIGDAAWSLTIFSGMGASLALAAGEYLGSALLATNDIATGLALWERNVRPFVDFHRAVSWAYLDFFTPGTRKVMRARKRMMFYNTHPLIAPWYRKLHAPTSRLFHGSLP